MLNVQNWATRNATSTLYFDKENQLSSKRNENDPLNIFL